MREVNGRFKPLIIDSPISDIADIPDTWQLTKGIYTVYNSSIQLLVIEFGNREHETFWINHFVKLLVKILNTLTKKKGYLFPREIGEFAHFTKTVDGNMKLSIMIKDSSKF